MSGRRWAAAGVAVGLTASVLAGALGARAVGDYLARGDAGFDSVDVVPTGAPDPLPETSAAVEPAPSGAATSAPGTPAPPSDVALPAPVGPVVADAPPATPPPTVVPGDSGNQPPPGVGSADVPLGAPSLVPQSTSYSFLATQADGVTPVAYDPCRQLRYVVRTANAPADGDRLLSEAMARLQAATGLQPARGPDTDEAPSLDRAPYQPDRYGQQWAPVLVAWVTEQEIAEVAGDVLGLAGSISATLPDRPAVYVSGTVYLDGPQLSQLRAGPQGEALVRSTIQHELAHLVGLGHVPDSTQLMNASTDGAVTDYQAGDLAGLARLGTGACVPEL